MGVPAAAWSRRVCGGCRRPLPRKRPGRVGPSSRAGTPPGSPCRQREALTSPGACGVPVGSWAQPPRESEAGQRPHRARPHWRPLEPGLRPARPAGAASQGAGCCCRGGTRFAEESSVLTEPQRDRQFRQRRKPRTAAAQVQGPTRRGRLHPAWAGRSGREGAPAPRPPEGAGRWRLALPEGAAAGSASALLLLELAGSAASGPAPEQDLRTERATERVRHAHPTPGASRPAPAPRSRLRSTRLSQTTYIVGGTRTNDSQFR